VCAVLDFDAISHSGEVFEERMRRGRSSESD